MESNINSFHFYVLMRSDYTNNGFKKTLFWITALILWLIFTKLMNWIKDFVEHPEKWKEFWLYLDGECTKGCGEPKFLGIGLCLFIGFVAAKAFVRYVDGSFDLMKIWKESAVLAILYSAVMNYDRVFGELHGWVIIAWFSVSMLIIPLGASYLRLKSEGGKYSKHFAVLEAATYVFGFAISVIVAVALEGYVET